MLGFATVLVTPQPGRTPTLANIPAPFPAWQVGSRTSRPCLPIWSSTMTRCSCPTCWGTLRSQPVKVANVATVSWMSLVAMLVLAARGSTSETRKLPARRVPQHRLNRTRLFWDRTRTNPQLPNFGLMSASTLSTLTSPLRRTSSVKNNPHAELTMISVRVTASCSLTSAWCLRS